MPEIIASKTELSWAEVNAQQDYIVEFTVHEPGYVEMDLWAKSESDWSTPDRESSVLRIFLQDEYNQHCVLFYGERPFTYSRLLGHLQPGQYRLRFAFSEESSPAVTRAFIQRVDLRWISDQSPLAVVYKHTPILYGRNLTQPIESRFTDTPLVLFYALEQDPEQTIIEYQMLYSHEDGGTAAPMLMAKWGRMTDIEWTYRVVLDGQGVVRQATYQGPHHVTGNFNGRYDLGGHPVLQAAAINGMVSDQVTSAYRFVLPPAYRWDPATEPRERVMDVFPFTYQVSAWETNRQYALENPVVAKSLELADLRNYLFVQTAKFTPPAGKSTCIDVRVKLKGSDEWYSSSFDDFRFMDWRAAYQGPYPHFSTTVKLPAGTRMEDLDEIQAALLPDGEDSIRVQGLQAFMLDDDYLPRPAIRSDVEFVATQQQPVGTLWSVSRRD